MRKKNKETKTFSASADIHKLIAERADRLKISRSEYICRLILADKR